MTVCWLNGQIVPREKATVSIFDHGVLYGDGVFEGIRFYNNRVFRLESHLQRLHDSAVALALAMPFSLEQLTTAITDVIKAFHLADGYIRLVITRGEGRLGINPFNCSTPTVFIIADELALVDESKKAEGAKLIVASTRRIPSSSLEPRIKSLNYLNNIQALMEAKYANADEAIMLNHEGKIAEGSADNVFIVKNNIVKTPPTIDGALEGITRGVVIDVARELGMTMLECSLTPYDVYTADECFLTGTGMELLPVREIDGRSIAHCPGEIYKKIYQGFCDVINRETSSLIC